MEAQDGLLFANFEGPTPIPLPLCRPHIRRQSSAKQAKVSRYAPSARRP